MVVVDKRQQVIMVCIHSVEEIPTKLQNALSETLRSCDKAVVLPQAQRSPESGVFKNTVFTLNGTETNVPVSLFSENWGTGISAIRLPHSEVVDLLRKDDFKKNAFEQLSIQIASEAVDSSTSVGPDMEGDETDRDIRSNWMAGFDSSTCLVGLYCGEHSRMPDVGMSGQNRAHQESFLICRAGAGVAAATFHSRLMGSLKRGKSLDEALLSGDAPGPQGLRRVSSAGSRNRARILKQAADILGFHNIHTVNDHACPLHTRCAVTDIEVHANTLQRGEHHSLWVYNTGIDCGMTNGNGLITSSNVSDGFVVYVSTSEKGKVMIRNDACSSLPFSSMRRLSNRDIAQEVVESMRPSSNGGKLPSPDEAFVLERFIWRNRDVGNGSSHMMPLCFHGTHHEETFTSTFARELGIDKASLIRVRPEIVCVAGIEAGKLRPMMRKWEALNKEAESSKANPTTR